MATARTPIGVTFSVWKALFLREAVHRLFGSRAAWVWLLLEPVVHIAFIVVIMTVVRMRSVGGIDTAVWIMVGMVGFFMFKRAASQGMNAVGSNQALFAYRQVKPVDTVLVRAGLEAFLMLLVSFVLFAGAGILGLDVVPVNPLAALEGIFGLWLIGLGFGLIGSVASALIPELGKIIELMMTPLYFLSGVMLPIIHIPMPYREWLMYNPLPNGLEAVRLGFFPYYQAVPETSIAYLYTFALIMVFFGLALHVRFALRLATQ
ncbi:MAG TPA: ABC transporter permease [Gammaproteobacteria bacterium]